MGVYKTLASSSAEVEAVESEAAQHLIEDDVEAKRHS